MSPVIELAQALDAEDYPTARKLLSATCGYEFRSELIEGADAIIDSYRVNGENGNERFDSVVFESSVSALRPDAARIDYTDIVTLAGETHIHRCAQEVTVDSGGLVCKIKHIDLPGEREALQEFIERHG